MCMWRMRWESGKFNVAISEAKYRCEKCVVNCGYEGWEWQRVMWRLMR